MNIEQDIDSELARLARLAMRMDAIFVIPRTRFTVGLDNILGLIPVVGDLLTLGPSVYIIWRAWKIGATPGAIAAMIGNLLMDLAIGSIPVVGDIFDVAYNANIRNFRILRANLNKRTARAREVRTAQIVPVLAAA